MNANEDMVPIATLLVAGILVPFFAAVIFHDVVSLYLSGQQYTYLVAGGFCLVAWSVLSVFDLDRLNFVTASIAVPVVFVFLFPFVVVLGGPGDVPEGVTYVVDSATSLFTYAGAFLVASLAAAALQRGAERLSRERTWIPNSHVLAVGLTAIVALGLLSVGGYATVTASSASVSDVEATVLDQNRVAGAGTPALLIDVEGESAPLRVAITGPDGDTVIERLRSKQLHDGKATLRITDARVVSPLQTGEFEVTLSALTGITVDRSTYTVERGPTPAIQQVQVAPPGEELDLGLASDAPVRSAAVLEEVRVGTVLRNEGSVPGRFTTRLLTGDAGYITLHDVTLEPGQQGGTIQSLSEETTQMVRRESDGRIEVQTLFDGTVVETRHVTVPGQ